MHTHDSTNNMYYWMKNYKLIILRYLYSYYFDKFSFFHHLIHSAILNIF